MENLLGRQLNYTVHTSVYEGPLDLLLDLIERAELDITSVSLATVTAQYLASIKDLEQLNADEISAFLVIAAKLLQIKSEALLPRPPTRAPGVSAPSPTPTPPTRPRTSPSSIASGAHSRSVKARTWR